MKKALLFFIIFFCSIFTYGQNNIFKKAPTINTEFYVPHINSLAVINVTPNGDYNGWNVYGKVCSGCSSYYWQILRSSDRVLAENGKLYYYYYVNFYSNSYYTDGSRASTFLSDIHVIWNGSSIVHLDYLLIPNDQPIWGIWLRSVDPNLQFSIVIKEIKVF